MSQKWDPYVQSMQSNANFGTSQWLLVKTAGDTDIDLAGAGEACVGVLTDAVGPSDTSAKYVDVQMGRLVKVECGATVTDGAALMSNGAGEAIPATDGNFIFGFSLQDAADGELMSAQWAPSYYEIT